MQLNQSSFVQKTRSVFHGLSGDNRICLVMGRDGSPTIKPTTYAVSVNLAGELTEKPAKSIP